MTHTKTVEQAMRDCILSKVRTIPDFPTSGVEYKDITPILQDAQALKYTTYLLARPFHKELVDKVISIESRGFLLGPSLAQDLNAGFTTVRKLGKLPRETVSVSYQLEYATNTIEIHKDAIQPNDRVLIHDDLLATGGSVGAATKLVTQLGGQVCGYSFIIELSDLAGRQQLDQAVSIESVLSL